jgi:hypothetical protein
VRPEPIIPYFTNAHLYLVASIIHVAPQRISHGSG